MIALLSSTALLSAACSRGPDAPPGGSVLSAEFVGRAACLSCHEEQAALWRGSHHDRAMEQATEETVLGDFADASFTYAGVTSTFFRRDGRFMVRTDGPAGEIGEWPVVHTFGVEPLQQYLVDIGRGRLQALTIAWDARSPEDGGQRWFHLYSEEDARPGGILHWTGPYQNWNYMCSECHSTDLRKNYVAGEDRYDTAWSEIDVACEACHGPGSRHVTWVQGESGGTPDTGGRFGLVMRFDRRDGSSWILDEGADLARMSGPVEPPPEIDACGRCHSRRTWIRQEYEYGRPLLDTHRIALLDENLYHPDGQILEEVYVYGSFLQSRMHRAGVTCTDCHDPHSARLVAEGNGVCVQCHRAETFATPDHHFHQQGGPGSNCVDCHMIVRPYMVVDPRHDHSFRIPRPDLTVKIGTPNACNDCHADRSPAWAADALVRRFGPERPGMFHYGEAIHAAQQSRPGAARMLRRVIDDSQSPGIARATALDLLARYLGPRSLPSVERALDDEDPLVRIGALRALVPLPVEERLRLTRPRLDDPVRNVRLEAARLLAEVPRPGVPREWRARLDEVIEEYRQAQLFNADRVESHLNLGWLRIQNGETAEAEKSFRTAIRMQPRFIPAYLNLADLYRAGGREEEGEALLREAIGIQPDSADARHALGLLLVRRGRLPEALVELHRAVEAAPSNPRYAYVYGVALEGQEGAGRAIEALERAQREHPADREILSALATYNEREGHLDAAARWAGLLLDDWPDDARWRSFLERIEGRRRIN